ncbi:ferritin-like domain-containing protein [uncultured Sphingomonas sp.]|uniref:ferritin-like domain-containing protein n=1 Tax=uncultured Sphingomonas sp. TaxID=158754 RepID=UPI0025D0B0EB|nr:ferritin-like domain-containing protein [uncultured Sphingomonas sp.]
MTARTDIDSDRLIAALDARVDRREQRRAFFRDALGAMAVTGALGLASGASAQSTPTPTPTATPTPTYTDQDILNFALNLEYLEAQFYAFAANGTGLASTLLTGAGTAGTVTGGRKANLNDPIVANYAREIAQDELAHVEFLRTALGSAAIAMPTLDISATPTSAFSNAARAAGLIGQGATFDPYENDDNFLLAAYLFEDVGVTAYRGAIGGLANALIRQVASGILAAEAYHAAMIRSAVFMRGLTTPTLIDASEGISNARDGLDGQSDIDQGVRPIGDRSNIMPFDATTGLPYGRTTGQVLNIAYLNRSAVTAGGFFPAGVNGAIKSSAAN